MLKASSSGRAALVGLSIAIPARPTLEKVITSVHNREPNISLSSLLLSSADIQQLVDAFAALPAKSPITLWISQTFTNPHAEEPDDLMSFWNAVKYKVIKIIWDQNRFYKRFLDNVAKEIKQDPNVARCEFQLCDQTDSVASAKSPISNASTPMSASASPSPYRSGVPFFPAAASKPEEDEPKQQSGFVMDM